MTEPYAHAVFLCRLKGAKEIFDLLRRYPASGVFNPGSNCAVVWACYGYINGSVALGQALNGVQQQISKNFFQQLGVSRHDGWLVVRGKVCCNGNAVSLVYFELIECLGDHFEKIDGALG